MTIRLVQPRSTVDWRLARRLIEEYASSLNLELSFQDISHELEHLDEEYGPPAGVFLLAKEGGSYLGCVGLRRFSADAGEIKRLYIVPAARGRGVGRLLAEAIVTRGRQLAYKSLLLDTLPSMQNAQRLYLSLGFRPTAAYRYNPVAGTTFLELKLHPGT